MSKNVMSDVMNNLIRVAVTLAVFLILAGFIGFQMFHTPERKLAGAIKRGNDYLIKENFKLAKEEFLRAVELDTDDPIIYLQLAEALEGLNDYELASHYLKRAMELEEKSEELSNKADRYASLCIKLADCYSMTGELEKCLEVLEHGLELTASDRLMLLLAEYDPTYFLANKKEDSYVAETENSEDKKQDNSNSMNLQQNKDQSSLDEKGNIIWVDKNVEAEVRSVIQKPEGPLTKAEVENYDGSIDLTSVKIKSLADLVWLKKLAGLSCKGRYLNDAEFINSLELDRVTAVYRNMEDVKYIENTEELNKINHLGICVSHFSLGNMTIIEMLEFYSKMNQLMDKITNLEYLDLSYNGLKDISLIGEIKNINSVKYLILNHNEIEDISVLRNFKNLTYLDVLNNKIKDFSPVKHVNTVIGKDKE